MDYQPDQNYQPNQTKPPRIVNKKLYLVLALAILLIIAAIISVTTPSNNNRAGQKPKNVRTVTVRITKAGFEPSTIVVKHGTKIIWVNQDQALHQIASNPYPIDNDLPGLKSMILNNDQSYEYIANRTGTFGYHDDLKPMINGSLEVRN